jgi:hypothetical protein
LLFFTSSEYKSSHLNGDTDLMRLKTNRVAVQFSELYSGDDERQEESDDESDVDGPESDSDGEGLQNSVSINN